MNSVYSIIFFLLLSTIVDAQYEVLGDAFQTDPDTFVLTPDTLWQNGSVWYTLRHDFTTDFTVSGKYYFGEEEDGADGITFVIQDNCIGEGQAGVGIGYEDFPGNSIAVEFDTYENAGGVYPFDPPYDHVAILRDGIIDHTLSLAGPVQMDPDNVNVEDGIWHTFQVRYSAGSEVLEVSFDGFQRLSYQVDIVDDILQGDPYAYWGFTSATGGFSAANSLIIDSLTVFTIPDTTICDGSVTFTLPEIQSSNVTLNKPTNSSSNEGGGTGAPASDFAFDGDFSTRWSSGFLDQQWVSIDLITPQDIDSVILFWEAAYATEYKIQTSPDNINWTDQFHETNGDGGTDLIVFSSPNVRYVRMLGIQRATIYGFSLWEFEVYATGQYDWFPDDGSISDPNSNAPVFTPTVTTTYTVTIPDNCLGSTNFDFTITITELTTSEITDAPNCNGGSDGSITLVPSGGTSPYSFLWSNNETSPMISALNSGIYQYTITDANNCSISSSVELPEPASALEVNFLEEPVTCNGSADGSITLVPSGGTSPYSFLWSNNETSPMISALNSGIYQYTITDANNCSISSSVELPEPASALEVNFLEEPVTCNGSADGSITLVPSGGTSPYSFLWSGGQTDIQILNLAEGIYSVTVTDSNGCEFINSDITITEPQNPVTISIISISSVFCEESEDGFASVSASGGSGPYTYIWSNGETGSTASGLGGGSHQVTVTDQNGCSASQELEIPVTPFFIEAVVVDAACEGINSGAISITGTGGTVPYVFSIDGGDSFSAENEFTDLSPGTYELLVQDANGCLATEVVSIGENSALTISAGTGQQIQLGDNVISDAMVLSTASGVEISWSPATGLSCTDCQNPVMEPIETTTYTLTVIDGNGCVATDEVLIIVDKKQNIYIPNAFSPNGDGINDFFTIYASAEVERIKTMNIFGRWGEFIYQATNFEPNSNVGWNGTFKGEIMDNNVFVYYFEVLFVDGSVAIYKGDVQLIK